MKLKMIPKKLGLKSYKSTWVIQTTLLKQDQQRESLKLEIGHEIHLKEYADNANNKPYVLCNS